jgi:DNA-binding CsgD family transcriptional regulator
MLKALTPRELAVLKLVPEGKPNREVAEFLSISVRTVEGHRARAMMKLNLSSLSDLVRYAVRVNLIEVGLAVACGAHVAAKLAAVLG